MGETIEYYRKILLCEAGLMKSELHELLNEIHERSRALALEVRIYRWQSGHRGVLQMSLAKIAIKLVNWRSSFRFWA